MPEGIAHSYPLEEIASLQASDETIAANKSFSPEETPDENPSEIEYTHVSHEVADLYPSQKIKLAELKGWIPDQEKDALSIKAWEAAVNPKKEWAGQAPTRAVVWKLRGAMKHHTEHGANGEDQEDKIVEQLVGQYRGWFGERVSAAIPLASAETHFVSLDIRDPNALKGIGKYNEINDITTMLGTDRKDIILKGLMLKEASTDTEYIQETANKFGLKPEIATKIINAVTEVHLNYSTELKTYRDQTGFKGNPQTEALCFWEVKKAIESDFGGGRVNLNDKEKDTIRYMLEEAQMLAGNDKTITKWARGMDHLIEKALAEKPTDMTALESAKEIWENSYFGVTVPDGFVGEKDFITAGVEMKTYTKEDFDNWLTWLEKGYAERNGQIDNESNEVIIVEGLQVMRYTQEDGARVLGPNIAAEKRFLQAINSSKTPNGEKYERIAPMILRLTNDITTEQLDRLVAIAQEQEITNFVIQVLPVSSTEVNTMAQNTIKHTVLKEARNDNTIKPEEINILNKLANPDVWK